MQKSQIPTKFQVPFASSAGSGYIRPIPLSVPTSPGGATLQAGFNPNSFVPVGSGGNAPFGEDFNGILFQSTSWDQWYSAGGPVTYDSTFQSAIGGYPQGAIVASATTLGVSWFSTADNNTTNPDSGGAGWVAWPLQLYGADSGSVNAIAVTLPFSPPSAAFMVGVPFLIKVAYTNTTTMPTVSVANIPSSPAWIVINPNQSAIGVGQITAGSMALLVFDGTYVQLLSVSAPLNIVPATGAQLQFYNTTEVLLAPYNGGQLWINGANYKIPTALYLANSGLSDSTFFYVYAFMAGATMTLEASATGYTFNANGIPQKTGDATRTLVGNVTPNASGLFEQGDGWIGVQSWFNQRLLKSVTLLPSEVDSTSESWVEISSILRNYFSCWANQTVQFSTFGSWAADAGAGANSSIGFDGTTPEAETIGNRDGGNSQYVPLSLTGVKVGLSEGTHYGTLLGITNGANAGWSGGASAGLAQTGIIIQVMG